MFKDTDCGELSPRNIGTEVTLAGWVHRRRDHGGLVFFDLRDRSGIVQVVVNPETAPEAHREGQDVRHEWVLQIRGLVTARPHGTENSNIATGMVEVVATSLRVLNPSKIPPFSINEDGEVEESLRLRYRYLYLRKPKMLQNLVLRHRIIKFIRDFLDQRDFLEVETPMLIKATPEGARDYLVPSRVHPGHFYALPQSPQQLKQLLMIGGLERYFQIVRCFRDEDLRADRQPEFTQLDLEISFVEMEDVLALTEALMTTLVTHITPEKHLQTPFPRLSYQEAIDHYGSDKPDLRFGLKMADISDIAEQSEFQVFRRALESNGIVKGFAAPGCSSYSRSQIDELTAFAQSHGARGLVAIGLSPDGTLDSLRLDDIRSPAMRYLEVDQIKAIATRFNAQMGDLLLIVGGERISTNTTLSALRHEMGNRLGLANPDMLAFAFITHFPLFKWSEEQKRWESVHHPFTAPVEKDISMLDTDPSSVISEAYDLVCNGTELASGSIRIHTRKLQEKILAMMGYSENEVTTLFGHLLSALDYGAPPHGGIAPGIDRLVMLLANAENLRAVIAFPKTQNAADLLFDAPSPVSQEQLDELHLRIVQE